MKNTKKTVCAPIATLALTGSLIGGANAAVLTFDIDGLGRYQNMNQGYGDNITATTMDGFSYGSAEGFTPNVTVEYGGTDPAFWTTGYGDLTNVLFEDEDGTGVLTVTLRADEGYEVALHGFDVAAYASSSQTIDLVGVSSATGSVFSQANAVISETTSTYFSFTPVLQASELTITVDARNLGSSNDNIAIDNIVFSQVTVVPEPSSLLLLGLGGWCLAFRRSRC